MYKNLEIPSEKRYKTDGQKERTSTSFSTLICQRGEELCGRLNSEGPKLVFQKDLHPSSRGKVICAFKHVELLGALIETNIAYKYSEWALRDSFCGFYCLDL